jgi:signal transduction histidine kinase/predicted RNA-binding protein with RPS1 domain/ActR/RegA family two-component response regulator
MGKMLSDRIRIKVIRHLPLGLFVELENGDQGIVRVREISWEQEKRINWKQLYPVDAEEWAVPISMRAGHPYELSLRLAKKDPWVNIFGQFSTNEVYVGVVTGVMGYGAFIELAPGITGLLHESKLPERILKPPLELFWPGDRVRVVIEQVDSKKRRLKLRLPLEKIPASEAPTIIYDSLEAHKQAEIASFIKDKSNRKRILVVEDDPDQGKLVSNWLIHIGQIVEVVRHAEEALASLGKFSPDIVLIDIGLPGMDGIALANRLLETHPHLRLVLSTEYTSAEKRSRDLNSLLERGVDFLIKPLFPDDLLDFLKKNGNHEKKTLAVTEKLAADSGLFDSETSPTSSMRFLLQKSRMRLGFDAAILFQLDTVRRTVSIVESSTQLALNTYALPSLIYSPVREIAEDEEPIVQERLLQEEEARFQYLVDLFPVQACIGLPVPVSLSHKYALLFLDSEPRDIYEEDQIYVEAAALTIGTYLEHGQFQEKATIIQRYALIGQLTAALVHEITNLMGPLNKRLEIFKTKVESFKDEVANQERTTFLKKDLGDIQQAIHKIVTTMRMLGRVIAKDKNEILRLDEIVKETINLMRDTADREHIMLGFTPPDKLLLIRSQSAALQQILLNLLLNAIQQTSEFRSGQAGSVHVSMELISTSAPNSTIRILVKDNGPGIHTSLWETIFELGYSTRQDGSGIGLYISKSLAEEKLKGRLYVHESCILGGTTIALEIPHRF